MMMIIITRYPASEDRLIVRPLLSRVCALRLQPAEPQPYTQGPQRLFWRTRAAQVWHPQNRALRVPHLSTPALQSTGGGQVHDRRARWFSLVASGQVELQETTELRNRKESYSLNDLF